MEPKTGNVERINNEHSIYTDIECVRGELLHGSEFVFDAKKADAISSYRKGGSSLSQDLIGVLMLGDSSVGVVRISEDEKMKIALSLIDSSGGDKHEWRLLSNPVLEAGVPLVLGRDDVDKADNTISRKHLYVLIDDAGKLSIVDQSGNGTIFLRHEKQQLEEDVVYRGIRRYLSRKKINPSKEVKVGYLVHEPSSWKFPGIIPGLLLDSSSQGPVGGAIYDYTNMGVSEKKTLASKNYEESDEGASQPEIYQGRPTIHRDSPINGGVYIVLGSQEAIVVDDGTKPKNDSQTRSITAAYANAMNSFLSDAKSRNVDVLHGVKDSMVKILLEVSLNCAMRTIKYDSTIADYAQNAFRDRKINLSEFIIEGAGVCRHQALMVGYLLERLINEGYLGGKVSVDRNRIPGKGGHAWARYVAQDGTVYIIDPAQEYVGTLKESLLNSHWVYSRPEDRL